jgi:hypothetical protein
LHFYTKNSAFDKKVIGDDTEDPLAGYDVKFSGQVPYLPWVKVKATLQEFFNTNFIASFYKLKIA